MIITIIVLLILAGVTIAAINGNESAMSKAQDAKRDTDIAEAKEAAILTATEYIQDYMDKKYVKNESFAEGINTTGDYVAAQMKGKTSGNFTFSTSGSDLTVSKSGTTIVTGTIDTDGKITWDATSDESGNGGGEQQGGVDPSTIPNSVYNYAKAGTIKRWDTISYDPGNGSISSADLPNGASIEKTKLASLDLPTGASIAEGDSIDASDAINWQVLDVNQKTGEVLIIPRNFSAKELVLDNDINGYNAGVEAMNIVAQIYLNTDYAKSARSITLEDVCKVENFPVEGENEIYNYNSPLVIDSTTLKLDDTGNYSNQTFENTPKTRYETYVKEMGSIETESFGGTGNSFWLASRYIEKYDNKLRFYIPYIDTTGGYYSELLVNGYSYSQGTDYTEKPTRSHSVLPVIILKPEVQLVQGTSFYTETATATTPVNETTEFEHHSWSFNTNND